MGCSYLRRLGRGQRSSAGVDSTWPRTQEGLDKLPCRLTSLDTGKRFFESCFDAGPETHGLISVIPDTKGEKIDCFNVL